MKVFPDDPSRGCPFGTGAGVLPTGLQDKRINWVYTEGLQAGVRFLSRKQSQQAPVYKFHFTQVPQNGTIDAGVAHFYEIPYVGRRELSLFSYLDTYLFCRYLVSWNRLSAVPCHSARATCKLRDTCKNPGLTLFTT